MKDDAQTSNEVTVSIVNKQVTNIPSETFKNSLKRALQRVRDGVLPPNPRTLTDLIEIPDRNKLDTDVNDWLLKFNVHSKLTVFAKKSNLLQLNHYSSRIHNLHKRDTQQRKTDPNLDSENRLIDTSSIWVLRERPARMVPTRDNCTNTCTLCN
ncbi:hypothetical protein C0J52_02401 [Blattella germanica]|nr:hypothetical protein C0J52_02401 [Blattella germanica]